VIEIAGQNQTPPMCDLAATDRCPWASSDDSDALAADLISHIEQPKLGRSQGAAVRASVEKGTSFVTMIQDDAAICRSV
jgi:hypothetical protein